MMRLREAGAVLIESGGQDRPAGAAHLHKGQRGRSALRRAVNPRGAMEGDDTAAPASQTTGGSLTFAERVKHKAKKASDALLDEFLMPPEEAASSQSSRPARRSAPSDSQCPIQK